MYLHSFFMEFSVVFLVLGNNPMEPLGLSIKMIGKKLQISKEFIVLKKYFLIKKLLFMLPLNENFLISGNRQLL